MTIRIPDNSIAAVISGFIREDLTPLEHRIMSPSEVLTEQVNATEWGNVNSLCDMLIHLVEERNRKRKDRG